MGLLEQAKIDAQNFLGNTGAFSLNMVFKAPSGEELEVVGQCFDVTMMYHTEPQSMTGRSVLVNVSEQPFTDADYPIRRADGIITFKDHLVTVIYADGTTNKFKVFDAMPDKTINVISLQLQTYADN